MPRKKKLKIQRQNGAFNKRAEMVRRNDARIDMYITLVLIVL